MFVNEYCFGEKDRVTGFLHDVEFCHIYVILKMN